MLNLSLFKSKISTTKLVSQLTTLDIPTIDKAYLALFLSTTCNLEGSARQINDHLGNDDWQDLMHAVQEHLSDTLSVKFSDVDPSIDYSKFTPPKHSEIIAPLIMVMHNNEPDKIIEVISHITKVSKAFADTIRLQFTGSMANKQSLLTSSFYRQQYVLSDTKPFNILDKSNFLTYFKPEYALHTVDISSKAELQTYLLDQFSNSVSIVQLPHFIYRQDESNDISL